MKKTKLILRLVCFLIITTGHAQKVELSGLVDGDDDVEGVHILNKTSLTNATSDAKGGFTISAKVNDTIIFTALQYKTLFRVVTDSDVALKSLQVKLEVFVNELDEVYLIKPLSGNLTDDILASTAKPKFNFYDVGIPGYKGKQKTLNERRLYEAGEFKPEMLLGLLLGVMPLNPVINAITGRTKKLKEQVQLEKDDALLSRLKNELSEDFFENNILEERHHVDFFYFVQEDPLFRQKCSTNNLEALAFFKLKLEQYKLNLSEKE